MNNDLAKSRQYCKQVMANRLTELLESELNKVNDELTTSRQYCKQVMVNR